MKIKDHFLKRIAKSTLSEIKFYNQLYPKRVISIEEIVAEMIAQVQKERGSSFIITGGGNMISKEQFDILINHPWNKDAHKP